LETASFFGIQKRGLKTLEYVVKRLYDTICDLADDMVKSLTLRQGIFDAFLD